MSDQPASKWVTRWNDEIAAERDAPGVWRRKAGGFRVRGHAIDPRTGRKREINRVLPDVTRARDAGAWLAAELAKVRAGGGGPTEDTALPHVADYSASLFEKKVSDGKIASAATREKWEVILRKHLIPAFGAFYVDKLTAADVEAWKATLAPAIKAGKLSPTTGNTILSVLRVITAAASRDYDIRDPMLRVEPFDTRHHRTYTSEAPNSLAPGDVPRFLEIVRRRYPQHYALVFLGLCTGLRPSSLRPLRKSGPLADVKWDRSVLLVRRSHTRKAEVMEGTKTGQDQEIRLPPTLLAVLREHVEGMPDGPMQECDLLFPTRAGTLRSPWSLEKAFAGVSRDLGLGYAVTPRSMRRTFQDLAREAGVADVVTRAISGHATEAMQRHYSTARDHEVESGLAKVIDLATARRAA